MCIGGVKETIREKMASKKVQAKSNSNDSLYITTKSSYCTAVVAADVAADVAAAVHTLYRSICGLATANCKLILIERGDEKGG